MKKIMNFLFLAAIVIVVFTVVSKVFSVVTTVFGWLKAVVIVPLTQFWNWVTGQASTEPTK